MVEAQPRSYAFRLNTAHACGMHDHLEPLTADSWVIQVPVTFVYYAMTVAVCTPNWVCKAQLLYSVQRL